MLTKGRIAVLSPFAIANEFVRPWPSSNTCFLGPTRVSKPNGISIGSAVLAYRVHRCKAPVLFNWVDNPQKLPLPCSIGAPSNTWFLLPTRVSTPNGISIDSAVFARLTNVTPNTHRPTDHATSCVAIGRYRWIRWGLKSRVIVGILPEIPDWENRTAVEAVSFVRFDSVVNNVKVVDVIVEISIHHNVVQRS